MAVALTTDEQIKYAALADEVYARDPADQSLSLQVIDASYENIAHDALEIAGTQLRRSGE